jgi:hypothetical protein
VDLRTKFIALITALAALILAPTSLAAAPAQKRVALVIGNGAYQKVQKLPNAVNDAKAVARMFKTAGFDSVELRHDLSVVEFKRVVRDFFETTQTADIAVVYFAGHGIQVGETNYMIPVDARLANEIDVQDETVSLDRILSMLQPAKRLRLVILDACRENPFVNRMKVASATRSISRGLARIEPENNTLVAFAAKSGQVALDGSGEHSPFTAALLKHLPVPGLDIRLALGRVRDDVFKGTPNKQEPFVYGSLGGDSLALVPAPEQPRFGPLMDVKGDYQLVERIGTRKAWEAFLASHNEGLYAELARAQLEKAIQAEQNEAMQTAALTKADPNPAARAGALARERMDWDEIKDSGDRARLREFIAKYPSSALAETARKRLVALDRAAEEQAAKASREEEACRRDDERLSLLRPYAGQPWARDGLKDVGQETACERIRTEVVALLVEPAADSPNRSITLQSPSPFEPVLSTISELRQLGCQQEAGLTDDIRVAIRSYLIAKGRAEDDIKLVERLITNLHDSQQCAANCQPGERSDGERCAADAKSQPGSAKRASQKGEEPRRETSRSRADRVPPALAQSQGPATGPSQPAGVGF